VTSLHRARFAVLSEESGFQCPPGMKYFAVVDPVDGTDMALRGLGLFAVCIACGPLDNGKIYLRNIAFATVCSPQGVFTALKGEGARFDNEAIRTSTIHDVRKIDYSPAAPATIRLPSSYARQVLLYLGSTALELCAVARGQLDAYIESRDGRYLIMRRRPLSRWRPEPVSPRLLARRCPRRVGPVSRSTLLVAANDRLFEQIHRALTTKASFRSD